jgi:hypothetical protein
MAGRGQTLDFAAPPGWAAVYAGTVAGNLFVGSDSGAYRYSLASGQVRTVALGQAQSLAFPASWPAGHQGNFR